MAPDTDALRLDVFNAATDAIRVRAGGNTQFVSSTIFPTSHAVRGTSIRQKVALYRSPAVGQNVDLKAYYTNRTKNVIRRTLDSRVRRQRQLPSADRI